MSIQVVALSLDTEELRALPQSRAEQIRAVFDPMADMVQAFEDEYNAVMALAAEEVTPEVSARARRLRLDIKEVRVAAEKKRKELKEEALLIGRAIDSTNNILKAAISRMEDAMEAIEKHAERQAAALIAQRQQERAALLAPYVEDAAQRDLGSMDEDVWAAYLGAKKQAHEDRLRAEREAAEARARAEEERAAELARLREENERALAAAREAERARLAELARIEKERSAEREAAEAERRRLAALEAAEQERRAQEEAAARARAAAERRAARAPVRKRLTAWVDSFALPELPGEEHEVALKIQQKFQALKRWAVAEIEAATGGDDA